jgi:hypothetical protein
VFIYCLHELPPQRNGEHKFVSLSQWRKRKHEIRENVSGKVRLRLFYSIYCGCNKLLKLTTTAVILFWNSRSPRLSFSCVTEEEAINVLLVPTILSSEHAKYYWRTKLSFLCYLLHNWWHIYFYHTGPWNNFNIIITVFQNTLNINFIHKCSSDLNLHPANCMG